MTLQQWEEALGSLGSAGSAGLLGPIGGTTRPAAEPLPGYFASSYDLPADRERISARYQRITRAHVERFGDAGIVAARAPGRINLIGEHTDYNGLPVFPMAINRDIAALFSPRADHRIVIQNTNSAFPERGFEITASIPPFKTGDWGNYCKAGVQGILGHFAESGKGAEGLRGFQATIGGDIPAAAGMSSSSALVVLSALMFLSANGSELNKTAAGKLELAELLARAEWYVGTQGGGMDQAISLMGRPGQALKIDFYPLEVRPVPLPAGYRVVVSNSLVQAAKTADALDKYNRRPIECRLAVAVLKRALAARYRRELPLTLLGDLSEEVLGVPQGEIDALADATLHEQAYTLAELAGILETSPEETSRRYCTRRDGTVFPEPEDGFKLRQRFRHVVEEGRRVERSVEALEAGDIDRFGGLMNDSHASCRDLYEISCPELDALVAISREAGAVGARLTGAGFGGCAISLVAEEGVEAFVQKVGEAYYGGYLKRGDRDFASLIFPCIAVAGAGTLAD